MASSPSAEAAKEEASTVYETKSNWTFWYDLPSKNKTDVPWEDLLQRTTVIKSINDFWNLYNNLRPPSQLVHGSNYYLFKEGIFPAWEDKQNEAGGKWQLVVPKDRRDLIDAYWLKLVLSVIGNQYTYDHEVCGVVVQVRATGCRAAMWTRSCSEEKQELWMTLGKEMKEILKVDRIAFTEHDETKRRGASSRATAKVELT